MDTGAESKLKKFQEFIDPQVEISKFMHQTPTRELADLIIRDGFEFENHLMHTTDQISGFDLVELNYFLMIRRNYGQYTVIIEIADEIINEYTIKLKNTRFHFSEVLSIGPPWINDDDNPVYRLAKQFIKGYFNQNTLESFYNSNFNPFYKSPQFEVNLKTLLASPK
jgi:hypothetical protein